MARTASFACEFGLTGSEFGLHQLTREVMRVETRVIGRTRSVSDDIQR